jgi:hypothetical protein
LAERDLAFERQKPIEKNFCGVGMGVAIHQDDGSRSRADSGPFGDGVGIELGDRQSLHLRAVDAPAEKTDGELSLGQPVDALA